MPNSDHCAPLTGEAASLEVGQQVARSADGLHHAEVEQLSASNEQKLRAAFAEVLCLPAHQITDDVAYDKTTSWDSVAHLVLVAAIDTTFDITMDTDDVIDMSSYAKAREILRKYEVVI
jgi:acyl carrier protein